jgi:hypothetical protein
MDVNDLPMVAMNLNARVASHLAALMDLEGDTD